MTTFKSNLEFIEHNPRIPEPLSTPSKYWRDYRYMTVKWKGLDFIRVIEQEDAPGSSVTVEVDEDNQDDYVEASSPVKKPSFIVQCLMPEFKVYFGTAATLDEAKSLCYEAEKTLVGFAQKIFSRRSPNDSKA